MPDQNFACSVEQHDKNSKILTITITAVGIIATLILSAMELNVMTVSGNPMSLTFAHVPIIVLSGLCGQIPGLIAVLTVFIHHAFADIDYSFYVFIYLMLCIGVSYIFKKKWYKDKKRYICCMLATTFILGDVWGFFTYVLENYHLPALNLPIILALFFCCLPETVLAFGALYFIYRKSPDRIRSYFPTTSAYARHLSVMKQIHKSRLSFRLFVVLTFQAAILCIAASIFANFLIDDIGHVVMRSRSNRA